MNANVEIGKFTLESLTTGMYEQPLIVYREYLQNAADALEDAQRKNLLTEKDMCVNIRIDTSDRTIEVYDNGSGIPEDKAAQVLLSIGSSQKIHTQSRGFRGIGRLGGISYCERLEFETTAYGSVTGIKVVFDCTRLKQLMLPGENSNMSMEAVLSQSSFVERFDASEEEHYFIVRMIGVDERTNLLDEELVTAYLSQTAPITYSSHFKMISSHIYSLLEENKIKLTEFPVFVSYDNHHPKPLHKAFSRRYAAGRGKDTDQDAIYEIEPFSVKAEDGELLAVGWYGKGSWLGTLKDGTIRGLRLRKGNIQIGDEHTLDNVFKQTRFNGWTQGEVFVLSDKLIPNARRDNFEQNSTYWSLLNALRSGVGSEISERIIEASKRRNDPVQKAVNRGNELAQTATDKQNQGFNSREEAAVVRDNLARAIVKLEKAHTPKAEIQKEKTKTIADLKKVLVELDEGTNYKIDTQLKGVLSKKEKKILQVASDVMTEYLDDQLLDVIMNEIVSRLSH